MFPRRSLKSISIGAFRQPNPPEDPFSVSLDALRKPIIIGYESQYIAAQEALKGFAELPEAVPKTFIFTGNALNQVPLPEVFAFAAAERAAAALIEYGANAYGQKGYRWVLFLNLVCIASELGTDSILLMKGARWMGVRQGIMLMEPPMARCIGNWRERGNKRNGS